MPDESLHACLIISAFVSLFVPGYFLELFLCFPCVFSCFSIYLSHVFPIFSHPTPEIPPFFPYFPILSHMFPYFPIFSWLFWGPTSEAHRGRGEAPRPRAVLGPGHPGRESAQAAADHGGTAGTFGQRCLADGFSMNLTILCVYIYIHVYRYMCIDTCIYIYTRMQINVCVYIYICGYVLIWIHIHLNCYPHGVIWMYTD